jgi:Domain of unknown function (DUF1911)/Domain of unknown function (DUF1910)
MTEAAFRERRRQRFLTEKYFKLNAHELVRGIPLQVEGIKRTHAEGSIDSAGEAGIFKDKLKLVRLHYTAGEPIESLKPLFADAMHWFAEWHRADETYTLHRMAVTGKDLRLDLTPLMFEDLFHFQLALDVVSLGVLLGEGDAVREAAAWMQSERESGDLLFETLIKPAVSDTIDVEEFFHVEPYDPLLDAVYTADTPEEASDFVKKYLDGWYKAFDGVPWHNGHLVVTDDYSNYEGYWAFEAAAVCVIHGIDDGSFRDHLVYPKDLADWAREQKVLEKIKPQPGAQALRLRCEAKQPCPQSGHWSTPAKANSRRAFKVGEVMPEIVDSPWGSTIWYWDELQGD